MPLPAFELVTSFPTKVLDDESQTLEAVGLFPHGVLHVRDTA